MIETVLYRLTQLPAWVRYALVLFGIVCVAAILLEIPGYRQFQQEKPRAFGAAFVAVVSGVWGAWLYLRRNGTPEYIRALIVWLLSTLYFIWKFVLEQ